MIPKSIIETVRRITDRDLCDLKKAIADWLKRRAQGKTSEASK